MLGANQLESDSMLASFPKLDAWYCSLAVSPPAINQPERFHLFTLAKALQTPSTSRCRTWTKGTDQILETVPSLLQHILATDSLAATLDTSVTDLYGVLAELAVKSQEGRTAFGVLGKLASKTRLAAFGFLAAWTAFNMDELEVCISECEKVDEPFAPVHTLLGQALLESGRILESIDALKAAAQIAPLDPLPLVQLVKAYLVSGLQKEAMNTIEKCRGIIGNNIEVECLAAMAITSGNFRPRDFCEQTLTNIAGYLNSDPTDIAAFMVGIELTLSLGLKDWARKLAESVDFSRISDPRQVTSNLSAILKKNAELQWLDISTIILDKAILLTRSRDLTAITQ